MYRVTHIELELRNHHYGAELDGCRCNSSRSLPVYLPHICDIGPIYSSPQRLEDLGNLCSRYSLLLPSRLFKPMIVYTLLVFSKD